MGVLERYNEKKRQGSLESQSSKSGVLQRYELAKKYGKFDVTQDNINAFINDANSFLSSAEEDYGGLGWGNASDVYSARSSKSSELGYKSSAIRRWLDSQKDGLDEETYKSLTSTLDGIDSGVSTITNTFKSAVDYFSKFKSEDEYNEAVKKRQDYTASLDFDLEAGQAEIDGLKANRAEIDSLNAELERLAQFPTTQGQKYGNYTAPAANGGILAPGLQAQELANRTARVNEINARLAELGAAEDLDATIAEKERYLNEARRLQEWQALGAVGDPDSEHYDPNFEAFSLAGADTPYTDFGKKTLHNAGRGVSASSIDKYRAAVVALYEHEGNATPEGYDKYGLIDKYRGMDDTEFAVFAYYLEKDQREGTNLAEQYIDSIEESLNRREAEDRFANLEGKWALELLFGVEAGLDQFATGVENLFSQKDYIPATSTQMTSQLVREDLGQSDFKIFGNTIGQTAYDAVTTTSNMLPSILASTAVGLVAPGVGQVVGAGLLSASAAGNGYAEMLNLGYTKEQARSYAALVGASEGLLQYAIGGIGKLGGKLTGKAVSNFVSKLDNAFARVAIKLGGEMGSEFLEESIQTFIEPFLKELATGEEFESASWDEILYSGLLGALSAAGISGVTTVGGEALSNYKANTKYGGAAQDLINEAREIGTEDALYFAEKYQGLLDEGKTLTGAQLSRLIESNKKGIPESDINKIADAAEARLTELGETGDVMTIASALAKQVAGQKLSFIERNALSNSRYGKRVANELNRNNVKSGQYTSDWVQDIGTYAINDDIYNLAEEVAGVSGLEGRYTVRNGEIVSKGIPMAKYDAKKGTVSFPSQNAQANAKAEGAAKNTTAKQNATERVFEASDNGKTIYNGEEVTVKEIASVKDGKITLRLDNGATVNASDVSFGSNDEAIVYEMVARMDVGVETANELVAGFTNGNTTAAMYAVDIPLAYQYGKWGFEKGLAELNIPEAQKRIAYNRGRIDAMTDANDRANAPAVLKAPSTKTKKNGIIYEGFEYDAKTATDIQKASIKGIETLAKLSPTLEFHVYRSELKNGKRVAYIDGELVKAAPNGYFTEGNKIYIDLNAGNNGQGAMLYTVSHEIGHYIRQWNAKGFKVLGDFLLEQYGKNDVPVYALIKRQEAKIKNRLKKEGEPIPNAAKLYDMAYEEMVCDAMSTMFADPKAYEKLADLKMKNPGVFKKLGEAIKKILDKLKSLLGIYSEETPDALEAQYVMQFAPEVYEKLQDLYLKAFVKAEANHESALNLQEDSPSSVNGIDPSTTSARRYQERTEYEAMPKQVFSVSTTNGDADSVMLDEAKSVKELRDARFRENGFTKAQIDKMNGFIKKMADAMADARLKYKFVGLQDIYDAKIVLDPSGKIVLSAMVRNSEYSVNFDFTKICKKRVTLQEVLEQLAREKGRVSEDGTMTEVDLSPANIKKINDILASYGVETACLCCFVESYRYNIQAHYQDKVVNVWNALVDEVAPNAPHFGFADQDINTSKIPDSEFAEYERQMTAWAKKTGKAKNVEQKMREFLRDNPVARKKLRFSDLVTEAGRTNLHKLYPEIEGLVASKLGQSLPKSVEAFAPYNGEIDLLEAKSNKDLVEYLFSIAGIRSQSFSDFMIAHVFDVLQKTASMAARKAPAHVYTKEIARAMLFGMTGEKHNMSVLFDISEDVDSWNAGLDENGDYLFTDYEAYANKKSQFVQSIGWKSAVSLQNTEGYSRDCGIIGVGFSYLHMLKLHNDPDIRQVIGYHTSSLPVEIKPLTHLDKAADYTTVQNTMSFVGFAKPNYTIPEGVPSYATPPQDITKGIKGAKTTSVSDTFDLKGTFERLAKGKKGKARTAAAKETLRMLLEYADSNGYIIRTSTAEKGHGDFDLYNDVRQTQDPYLSADRYIEYCVERGYMPAFFEFSMNQNYYKDIFDFNVFDRLSYNPETGLHEDSDGRKAYAPQTAVHMLNEDGSLSFPDNFFDIVDKQMSNYDRYRQEVSEKMPTIMTEVRAVTNSEKVYSDRDSEGHELSAGQQEFFKDSKVRDKDGNLLVVYHGTDADFTVFEKRKGVRSLGILTNYEVDTRGFFFSPDITYSSEFGKKVRPYYLDVKKPLLRASDRVNLNNLDKSGKTAFYDEERIDELYYILEPAIKDILDYEFEYSYSLYEDTEENVKLKKRWALKDLWEHFDGDIFKDMSLPWEVVDNANFDECVSRMVELGYDGLMVNEGEGMPNSWFVLNSNQAKLTTNKAPTSDPDIRYSDRDSDSISTRSLLANALDSVAQNDIERQKLAQYKQKISLIEAEQAKLSEIRLKIRELSFAKGPKDTAQIRSLQFEEKQTANRINTYDRQLLNLQATTALKNVLEREKKLAYDKAKKEGKQALANYREKAAATQRELITRWQDSRKKAVEGRNKTAMRHKIKDIAKELDTLLRKPTSKKHIKEELRKAVAEALLAINMDTVGADERVAKYDALIAKAKDPDVIAELTATRDRIQLQGENLKEKLDALRLAYERIKDSEDIELSMSYQEVIRNSIEAVSAKVGNTSIRDMTLEQLEMVYDLYSMIRKTIRDANKAFKAKKGETIMQMAESVNEEVRKVGGERSKRLAFFVALKRLGWKLLKPLVAFRTIGSDTLTELYTNLQEGEGTFFGDVSEAQAFIEEQYKKHGFKSWDMKETKTFTAKSGKSFELTLEQIMSLYAYSRREQAHAHIIEGGIVFEDAVTVEKKFGIPIKYEVTTKDAFNLSEETLSEIVGSLTEEQKAFVEEMQAYLSDTMGAKGNEVSMEMLGVKLFKEKFYLPIKSSQYYLNFSTEEAGEIKLKNPAFSKETVQHANNPIVLHNFTDLWAEHVNNMSMYHSFVLALEDFTRVYNYKTRTDANVETMSTKKTIETAYPGATKYISDFLKSLNGGVRMDTVGFAEKLTSLAKKGAVLGSASVAIQQPSAVMRAMAVINPLYFATSAPKSINLLKHKQDWAELKKYAPIAGIKEMGRFDVGMGKDTVDWIKSNGNVISKVDDVLGLGPAFMDEVTWVAIWNAVKRETIHKHKNLSPRSEQFLKIAGDRFTYVVSLTQVYDSVFSRSDIMRNKSWIAKALTAFMAEPTTTLNMLWDAYLQGKRTGSVKGFAKVTSATTGAVVASLVLNAALKSIIMAMRDDDEDESYAEKYVEHFFADFKDSLNPLNLIPVAKDVVSIFKGYDVERMDMALFSDLKNAVDAFNSDTKTDYEKWSGLIGAISAFFGLPVKNVERDIRGLITTVFGDSEETTAAGMVNAMVEGWKGEQKSNAQQLYEAMLNGDKEQVKRIEGRFKDQDAINTAIRKVIREKYEDGELSAKEAKSQLAKYGDMSADEAASKVQYWDFKQEYPDYDDLSESAVAKYYSDVKPSGISIEVYYDYIEKRSECKGTDSDGDGKTDSGSLKREILKVINSLPISARQKDALYFLNGWSESTLNEAPWR